jgi:hypothetical protein
MKCSSTGTGHAVEKPRSSHEPSRADGRGLRNTLALHSASVAARPPALDSLDGSGHTGRGHLNLPCDGLQSPTSPAQREDQVVALGGSQVLAHISIVAGESMHIHDGALVCGDIRQIAYSFARFPRTLVSALTRASWAFAPRLVQH